MGTLLKTKAVVFKRYLDTKIEQDAVSVTSMNINVMNKHESVLVRILYFCRGISKYWLV